MTKMASSRSRWIQQSASAADKGFAQFAEFRELSQFSKLAATRQTKVWMLARLAACLFGVWTVLVAGPVRAQTALEAGSPLELADHRLADARLVDITEEGSFSFQFATSSGVQTQTIDRQQIVRWGQQRSSGGRAMVWLADGSWLAGRIEWRSEQAIALTSDWFEPLELQTSQLRGLVLLPSPSLEGFDALEKQMLRVGGSADVVWNARSEQLSGVLSLKLRPATESGLPPSVSWLLKTAAAAEPVELESDVVQAIVFSPILRRPVQPPARTVHIDMRDGSRLHIIAIDRTPEGRVTLTLADNRRLETLDHSPEFALAVARITGEPERIAWLGELEPARYRFAEQAGELTWPLGRDQDLFGKPLSLSGEAVPHGIVMHAPSQVAYRWDGRPAKFLAEVRLYGTGGRSVAPVGSAECKVLVARQGKLVELYRSPVLRSESPAGAVEVDVSDAQLVVLLVEQADQGPVGDHVLWREARLVPPADGPSPKK